MLKYALALCALCAATQALSQPAPGAYRVVSFELQIDGEKTVNYFGQVPQGYTVLTKTMFISVLTADGRRPGKSDEEKAALLDTLIAYTGPYRVEGNKIIVDVQSSWIQAWTGKTQTRTWSVDGNRLTMVTEKAPYTRDPSKMVVAKLVFEKVE
jgi:hypothetical protein